MFEVEVHSVLRDFIKERGDRNWAHHLTMARLVARALRLERSALMQTGSSVSKYCWSYLMPVLWGERSVLLVAPRSVLQYLLTEEIPQLQDWLETSKPVRIGDRWEAGDSLLLTTPESWLSDRLKVQHRFPANIPTIIDRAEDLEQWTRKLLTINLSISDWNRLMESAPQYVETIRDTKVKLTKAIFSRPQNPYQCYLLSGIEPELIQNLCAKLASETLLTPKFSDFWQLWQERPSIIWSSRDRERGVFELYLAPVEVATSLQPIWQRQPVVVTGSFLDLDASAPIYRHELGIEDILCLKFSPDRQYEPIQLYIPDRLPMHNTPQFQPAVLQQVKLLVGLSNNIARPVVILVEDVPLQAQVGSVLASEFGSRVRVEDSRNLSDRGILVCGWSFWKLHQDKLPVPQLLIVVTLPLPSLENPLVASRVTYYKKQRQDWFRYYLLPSALRRLQQAIVPLRESQGVVALLDNRVNFRSYGKTILAALEPCARINYIDPSWFGYLGS
ncbi:helicase C-terminal domain-containing protein [Myxosarcina sp. GI1]|uniref:helicase C-terminal domain-containing protein n=1 Tax=Myxosarcina sp. GI1 TaxID=1541065 RepID=UPI000563A34E|nr:helicase C-terminal domain-containing protein [Myxosarcina sp. GI1]